MSLRKKLSIGTSIMKARLLNKKRTPIFINWIITDRCNLKCKYCFTRDFAQEEMEEELETGEVIRIIDELHQYGCKRLKFTGGEPLLRKDLYEIIKHCRKKKIFSTIVTNGLLIPKSMQVLKAADFVHVSLDGPKEIQDQYRGEGTHDNIIKFLEQFPNKKIMINCTVYKQNIGHLDYVLDIGKKFHVGLQFGSVYSIYSGDGDSQILPFLLSPEDYREAFSYLITKKKEGYPIRHSLRSLQYWLDYPNLKEFKCVSGKISFTISPGGRICQCIIQRRRGAGLSLLENPVREAIEKIQVIECHKPELSSGMELSPFYHLQAGAIVHALTDKLFK